MNGRLSAKLSRVMFIVKINWRREAIPNNRNSPIFEKKQLGLKKGRGLVLQGKSLQSFQVLTTHQNYRMFPEQIEKDLIRFPKIGHKSKSVPSNSKTTVSSLELVTAKSWFYCTANAQHGYKSTSKREIASLTKIMTALCCLQLCDRFKINLKSTYFKVTEWACSTIGTTADLQENAWMTIEDLLCGLMLPSGNDAATVLCENLGAVLYFDKSGNKTLIEQIRSIDLTQDYESVKFYTQQFVSFMNNRAKDLRMLKTRFANPHGLDHINNYSCCEDVYLMCREAMQKETFRKIVQLPSHKGTFKFFKEGKVVCKPVFWANTNKLLEKTDVTGIKTGITAKAGGCLATSFTIDPRNEGFVIVLGSTSTESRFRDTLKIISWASEEASND